jgi:glycine cleavage system H protein
LNVPDQLEYTRSHEWIRQEGNIATIGITDYAQHALGEIVSVDLPEKGDALYAGESIGAVKSVDFVSVLCAPVGGEVVEINEGLFGAPWLINGDPYGEGWAIKVLVTQEGDLLSADEYLLMYGYA